MKKIGLTIVLILSLLSVMAQDDVIDMEAFWKYQKELSLAEKNKDRAKLKALKDTYGSKYDRKNIETRAKIVVRYYLSDIDKKDKETLAFAAAYHEMDFYKKRNKKDLASAIKYYEKIASNYPKKNDEAQVLYSYASFLAYLYKNYYYDKTIKEGLFLDPYVFFGYSEPIERYANNDEKIKHRILGKIGSSITQSGENGYKTGAYLAARLNRGYKIILNGELSGWDMLEYMWSNRYSSLVRQCADIPNNTFQRRNDRVVKLYTIAATDGKPQHQVEFAEYLLLTMCKKWYSNWSAKPGKNERPFIYKNDYSKDYFATGNPNIRRLEDDRIMMRKVLENSDLVDDEVPVNEIEEQLCYWYLQAAKQNYTPGMVNLALCMFYQMHPYDDSLHYSEMINWLEKAADLGNTTAMYNLSIARKTKNAYGDAFLWAKRGADSNDVKCQHLVGRYYYYGIGVGADKREALKWFKLAADNGSEGAAYMAGILYADKSVGNDMAQAVKYYELTSRIGEAYLMLAECYSKGDGVVMDKQKARQYEKKANEECYSCVSYEQFEPGLCFYSYVLTQDNRSKWKAEPDVLKQIQL